VIFIKSAQYAVALDEQGHLRVKASREGRISNTTPKETVVSVLPPKRELVDVTLATNPSDGISDVWDFSYKGKTVHLVTPTEIEKQLWDKLNAYVQLLKPNAGDKK
jgi:hypothetical protein